MGENYGLRAGWGMGVTVLCIMDHSFSRGIYWVEGGEVKSLPVCVPIFYGSEAFLVGVKSVTMSFSYVHNAFVLGRFQEIFSLSYNFPLWILLDPAFLFLDLLSYFMLYFVWKRSECRVVLLKEL